PLPVSSLLRDWGEGPSCPEQARSSPGPSRRRDGSPSRRRQRRRRIQVERRGTRRSSIAPFAFALAGGFGEIHPNRADQIGCLQRVGVRERLQIAGLRVLVGRVRNEGNQTQRQ